MSQPKNYGLNELREMFLHFFETKDHLRLPSFSLIPQNDASLLLINSGMAPMKPAFHDGFLPKNKMLRPGHRGEALLHGTTLIIPHPWGHLSHR